MAISLLILIAIAAILVLGLAAALIIVAVFVSDRQERWTTLIVVGVLGLLFLCCLLGAGGIFFYSFFQPK